jgi:hypothetical protein
MIDSIDEQLLMTFDEEEKNDLKLRRLVLDEMLNAQIKPFQTTETKKMAQEAKEGVKEIPYEQFKKLTGDALSNLTMDMYEWAAQGIKKVNVVGNDGYIYVTYTYNPETSQWDQQTFPRQQTQTPPKQTRSQTKKTAPTTQKSSNMTTDQRKLLDKFAE